MQYCYGDKAPPDTLKFERRGDNEWYNTNVWDSGINRRLPISAYNTSQDDDTWLRGGYAEDGGAFTVTGSDQAGISIIAIGGGALTGGHSLEYDNSGVGSWGVASYRYNTFNQFWPTRDPSTPSSQLGAIKPAPETNCRPEDVNAGTCTYSADHGDGIAKLRIRPVQCVMDTENSHGHSWGFMFKTHRVCIFEGSFAEACSNIPVLWDYPANPTDSIGRQRRGNALVWDQVQNWPAMKGEAYTMGVPCEVPSGEKHTCATVVKDLQAERAKGDASPYKDVIGQFTCPLPDFAVRISLARIPYNLMSALDKHGGARDHYEGNFYTCEYRSNAIQNIDDLAKMVGYIKGGEVAPCCFARDRAAEEATEGLDPNATATSSAAHAAAMQAAVDNPDVCWYVPSSSDPPFQTGVPDDFAAGFVLNYASRLSMLVNEAICGELHDRYMTLVAEILDWYAIDDYPNVKAAFRRLGQVLRGMDAEVRDCLIATARTKDGGLVPLWGSWGDLNGNEGRCSVQRTTLNTRLECGTGIQKRVAPLVQMAHCGGARCPPHEQYRFCRRSCSTVYGEPEGRSACEDSCDAAKQALFDNCMRAFSNSTERCMDLERVETATCKQRCLNAHPDFECSSNLCLTKHRCDPFNPARCWRSPEQIEYSWDY